MKKLQLRHSFLVVWVLMASMILSGCYQHGAKNYQLPQAFHMNERLMDSLSFFSTHHYTNNYNFVVKADSLFASFQKRHLTECRPIRLA